MRKIVTTLFLVLSTLCYAYAATPEYVVLASESAHEDEAWHEVVDAIATKHDAEVVLFATTPSETLARLQALKPRYVAVVDRPENIGRDYVIEFHHTSREVDGDIYADFMWGIITGYDVRQPCAWLKIAPSHYLSKMQ